MNRWKDTENLKLDGKEVFDENWMDSNTIKYPKSTVWKSNRPPKINEIDLWEVILEAGGYGVYAAYQPYAELYVVSHFGVMIEEFSGYMANERLEQFLIQNNIEYPKTDKSPTPLPDMVVQNTLLIPNTLHK